MSQPDPRQPPKSTHRMTIARFSLSQAVLLHLLFFVVLLAGGLVIGVMPVDVYPDVDLDEATIDTFWPGATAEDVERLVTDRIEDQIQDVRGVSRILSDSKPDASLIRVRFRESLTAVQLDAAFRELRSAVERVTDLPSEAKKPLIKRISLSEVFPLLWVVVQDTGGLGEEASHDVILRLKPVLREIPGVAKVDDKLIRDRELRVSVDRERLRKLDLTLDEVANVLEQYNRNVPSGTLAYPRGEYGVRAAGEVTEPDQLGDIAVYKDPTGAHVYLRDIADISRDFERKTFFARFNGNDCKALSIAKTDEADSRFVADAVAQAIREFQEHTPEGIEISICLDSSEIIRSRMRILLTNLASGVVLVFLTLWGVMGLRNAGLAIVGIPFAFLSALMAMHAMGVSLNAVSLFALVLCSGMIVDDAIVVLENIYRHVERQRAEGVSDGDRRLRTAIINGTNEVMWPVISSSATTVVAFLPMLIMGGVTGQFFSIIPKTVAVVLISSLFECLLMIPVHYLTIGPRSGVRPLWSRLTATDRVALMKRFMGGYDRFLAGVLRYRYLVPLPVLALGFVALSVVPLLRVDLFPSDYQIAFVDVKAWDEASLDQTAEVLKPIEEIALSLRPHYVASVLSAGGLVATEQNTALWRNNLAQLHVQLADTPLVRADPDAAARELRSRIEQYVADHPDSPLESFKVWARQDGPMIGKPVAIRIETPDLGVAKRLAEQFKARLRRIKGVSGVVDDLDFGSRQINLRLTEDVASVHGLSQQHLAQALRTANDGRVVSTFKDVRSGEDLDVRLILSERFRQDLGDLLDIEIRTARGYLVRLREICEIDMSQGYAGIPHHNGHRAITVSAQVDTSVITPVAVNTIIREGFASVSAAHPNVRIVYGGEFQETARSFESLKRAYVIAIVVIYMLLATQFGSYIQPFVIIVTVPFSCVGVVAGLMWSDYPLTIMTFIAMVGLTGVVVNDSIVLLDFVNKQIARGLPVGDALRAACALRIRPVVLTTVTTVLGLLPLALGWGGLSKIWSPFASSFTWGLTFATLLTLVVVPAIYHIAWDAVNLVRGHWVTERSGTAPTSANSHAK